MLLNSDRVISELSEHWIINNRKLLLHDLIIYVLSSTAVRKELMKIHHDNSYTDHFEIEKIIDRNFSRIWKIMWKLAMFINIWKYHIINFIINLYHFSFLKKSEISLQWISSWAVYSELSTSSSKRRKRRKISKKKQVS